MTTGQGYEEQKPRKRRRSLSSLTKALDHATTKNERSRAHYDLALFHDNNGREAQAIPHYETAIALGIDHPVETEAHAWLASSLYKTGRHTEASKRARQALGFTEDPSLRRFLVRLLRRVDRASVASELC